MVFSEERELRDRLGELRAQRAASARAFMARLDHSSLTTLALSAVAARRADDRAAERERERRQAELRREWAARSLERWGPLLTAFFADAVGLPRDSPLLVEIAWRFDPRELAEAAYSAEPGGAIVARPPARRHDALCPIADIDAATVRAMPLYRDGELTGASFAAIHAGGSTSVADIVSLGRAIEDARRRLERETAERELDAGARVVDDRGA